MAPLAFGKHNVREFSPPQKGELRGPLDLNRGKEI
jgi:hypothetical protein